MDVVKPPLKSVRLKRIYRAYYKTIPWLYLISVSFAIFVYVSRAHQESSSVLYEDDDIQFSDEYTRQSAIATDDPSMQKFDKQQAVELEDFPYSPDTVVLPIAPFKQIQDKYDFRATLAIYLEHVKNFVEKSTKTGSGLQPPVFNFDWKDFVDLKILKPLLAEKPNCFRIGALGATTRTSWPNCLDEPQNLGFVFITPSLESETEFRLSIRGKSYLYTAAPLPNKLIFLAGDLAFVSKIGGKASIDHGRMIGDYVQRKILQFADSTPQEIIKKPVNAVDEIDEISRILKRDLINLNVPKKLNVTVDLDAFQGTPNKENAILANAARHYDDRHFRNTKLKSKDGKWVSEEYYDWRFFNKKLNNLNKRISLHNIVSNYIQLCNNLGITTWLAGESLTSWSENGLIGPWQDTVTFELPASHLSRLAHSFNYSLIIADPRNNTGSYLIDVSPWFLNRAFTNDGGASPDQADARIVDISTGIFIELYGVTQAPRIPEWLLGKTKDDDKENYLVTGRGNFLYTPKLLPLRRTLYEGRVINVPGELVEELPEIPQNYVYMDHLRLFVDKKKCLYVPEEEKVKFDQTYIGSCHDNLIWKEYNFTKYATEKFMEVNGEPLNVLDEVEIKF